MVVDDGTRLAALIAGQEGRKGIEGTDRQGFLIFAVAADEADHVRHHRRPWHICSRQLLPGRALVQLLQLQDSGLSAS